VNFCFIKTDIETFSNKEEGIQALGIGRIITKGEGTNGDPTLGEKAVIESADDVANIVKGVNVCIVTSTLGGGTGSGASPLICEIAKQSGALTIAVVTDPFDFEGEKVTDQASEAINRLLNTADTTIVIANENILEILSEDTPISACFEVLDEIISQVVIGLTDMFTKRGITFADYTGVRNLLSDSGYAVVGIGTGDDAGDATLAALSNPMLDAPLDRAQGVLVNVVGGKGLSLQQIDEALAMVNDNVSEDCNVVMGSQINEDLPDETVSVSIIATSFNVQGIDDEDDE
jgi:cell division protein FtsZ